MIITGTAQQEAWNRRAQPQIEKIAGGTWSVPVVFPAGSIRYTLCYVVADADGDSCILIDPGFDSDPGYEQLIQGLTVAGLSIRSVRGIVSTHLHADHLGMAERIVAASGAWFGMAAIEVDSVRKMLSFGEVEEWARWLAVCGMPPDAAREALASRAEMVGMLRVMVPDLALEEGHLLPLPGRHLRVIATPGHTAGHICIVDEDHELVFTGDHVLPRVSSNIGLRSLDDKRDALGEHLNSLRKIAAYDHAEVCPGHEYRFRGLAERTSDLRKLHGERTDELWSLLHDNPSSVWEIAMRLTWSRGWESLHGTHVLGAIAETSAHVRHLQAARLVTWSGPDGGIRIIRRTAIDLK